MKKTSYTLYDKVIGDLSKKYETATNEIVKLVTTQTEWDSNELIDHIKVNGPATIVFWSDNTKTVVKCSEADKENYDVEKAILMAYFYKKSGFSRTKTKKYLEELKKPYIDHISSSLKKIIKK